MNSYTYPFVTSTSTTNVFQSLDEALVISVCLLISMLLYMASYIFIRKGIIKEHNIIKVGLALSIIFLILGDVPIFINITNPYIHQYFVWLKVIPFTYLFLVYSKQIFTGVILKEII